MTQSINMLKLGRSSFTGFSETWGIFLGLNDNGLREGKV